MPLQSHPRLIAIIGEARRELAVMAVLQGDSSAGRWIEAIPWPPADLAALADSLETLAHVARRLDGAAGAGGANL